MAAKAYIGFVIALGAAAAVRGYLLWNPHDLMRFACYLILAAPASGLKVRLPGVMGTMSVLSYSCLPELWNSDFLKL